MSDDQPVDLTPGSLPPQAPLPDQAAVPADPSLEQARALYDGLRDIDRRPDVLSQILRPGMDLPEGMEWNTARSILFAQQNQPPEPEPDPWEQFAPADQQPQWYVDPQTGQAVQYAPEPQPFDPRQLAPVLEQYEQRAVSQAEARVQQMLQEQAQNMAIQNAVYGETKDLPDYHRNIIEQQTREMVARRPNVAPAEIAREVTQRHLDAVRAVQIQNIPPPGGGQNITPGGGPVPGDKPPSWDELAKGYGLNPSM